ncbi:hypothetical protein [Citrobacter freundii]|uniref:hypothetical protein n=1 Tax=Citrobacter freundii TaxID=546 RepID=UPI00279D2290|nr:hypothetical protein PXV97_04350 [Citrobacter freundii]HCB1866259.1 hypothetical protein [Citrobacter freundii]HEC0302598.1 hypothetical protein [Citrobacter freundii]
MTNGKRAMAHCKRFKQAICAIIALCEETSKNGESFGLIRFYLASELQFTDIPVKEREKHVTIAGYFVFARQGEEHGY